MPFYIVSPRIAPSPISNPNKMNPISPKQPQDSPVGRGMAAATQTPANAHLGQDKPGLFDQQGSVGKQFTPEGAIGGTAQKIGGPLDKEGMVGKQFTAGGSIGGTVQDMMGGMSKKSN